VNHTEKVRTREISLTVKKKKKAPTRNKGPQKNLNFRGSTVRPRHTRIPKKNRTLENAAQGPPKNPTKSPIRRRERKTRSTERSNKKKVVEERLEEAPGRKNSWGGRETSVSKAVGLGMCLLKIYRSCKMGVPWGKGSAYSAKFCPNAGDRGLENRSKPERRVVG